MLEPKKTFALTPTQKKLALGAAVLVPMLGWLAVRASCVGATPSPEEAAPVAVVEAPVVVDAGAPVAVPTELKTTATLVFSTVPSQVRAFVSWGKKSLGKIEPGKPLVVVRPRDSGPLDVTVRADGFLPVHTRAYTFSDSKILVKLTKTAEINTLLGYRVPVDAGVSASLDEEPPPPPGGTAGPAMPPTLFGN